MLEFFKALPPCLVGMEACATAHCWARELTKLGHQVRLMPAKDVKAYVKRNKHDAADAEAICEAVRRPTMRFGKQKLGPISKRGDRYLRRILVVGACAVLRYARHKPEKYPWLTQLLARKPFKVVAVALANKMARIAWALLAKGGTYRVPALAAAV